MTNIVLQANRALNLGGEVWQPWLARIARSAPKSGVFVSVAIEASSAIDEGLRLA